MRYLGSSASCVPTVDLIVCLDCWYHRRGNKSKHSRDSFVSIQAHFHGRYEASLFPTWYKVFLFPTRYKWQLFPVMYRYVASNRRYLLPQELIAELVARELVNE